MVARTKTTFTPDAEMFGYATASGAVLDRTNLPRAEIVHELVNAAVAAPGAGEFQYVVVDLKLPANFTYVLIDFFATIESDDVVDWNPVGTLSMGAFPEFQQRTEIVSSGASPRDNLTKFNRSYVVSHLPKGLMIGGGEQQNAKAEFVNTLVDGDSVVIQLYARWLMYDIVQFHQVAVNAPLLIR